MEFLRPRIKPYTPYTRRHILAATDVRPFVLPITLLFNFSIDVGMTALLNREMVKIRFF